MPLQPHTHASTRWCSHSLPLSPPPRAQFVQLAAAHRLVGRVQAETDAFLGGFHQLVPLELCGQLDASELQLLVCGQPTIEVPPLRATAVYAGGLDEHSSVVQWFWHVLERMSERERALVLRFASGATRVPVDGLDPALTLTGCDLGGDALPRAHTCFNQLVLPAYESAQQLREKLLYAAENARGFFLT